MSGILTVETALVVSWLAGFIFACFVNTIDQLISLLIDYFRKKKRKQEEEKLCNNCKHYKGCNNLHWLIAQGYPLPLCCQDFESKHEA